MLNREAFEKRAGDVLSILGAVATGRSDQQLTDLNVAAESFFRRVLNTMFGLDLADLNAQTGNAPGADLGDRARRVAYQVTVTKTHAKVQDAITKFLRANLDKEYDVFTVLVIGRKQTSYTKPFTFDPTRLAFDPRRDIVDMEDLRNKLRGMSVASLRELSAVIDDEVHLDRLGLGTAAMLDDDAALSEIRDAFDRPALQDPMLGERNLEAFERAIEELIRLIKLGERDGKLIAKPLGAFRDAQLKEGLQRIYQKVRLLGQLYTYHVRTGELIPGNNTMHFVSSHTAAMFDSYKQAVIDEVNALAVPRGLLAVPGVLGLRTPPNS